MILDAKRFEELSVYEFYEIMRVRAKIFIEEEKILYPDADGIDYDCIHVRGLSENGNIMAYLRMYRVEGEPGVVRFGRVLTIEHGKGLGKEIMDYAGGYARSTLGAEEIVLDSQKHAEGFYRKLGFEKISDEFIEAGIIHVKMRKKEIF